MRSPWHSTTLRALTLGAIALLAAVVANRVAAPSRRLAWRTDLVLSPTPATPPGVSESRVEPLPKPSPSEPGPHPQAPRPAAPVPTAKPAPTRAPEQVTSSPAPITEISSQQAWQAFQAGLPFLDARRSGEFTEGHLPGAWNTPVWEADLDDRLLDFKAQRRPGAGDAIVIYCSGGDCRDSQLLAEKLLAQGYFHLLIYREGYPDWVARNHPVEKGGR